MTSPRLAFLSALLAVVAASPTSLVAQALSLPVIHGTVRDSVRQAIADVEVILADTGGRRVAAAKSSADGRFTFASVARGMPHRVTFRKIGYRPLAIAVRPLAAGDTAALHVVLAAAVVVLPDVAVRARPERRPYSVDSLTIAARPNRDALDVIVRYPWMLGDGARECQLDTSVLTTGGARTMPHGQQPMSLGGEPFRLFVNGERQFEERVKDVLASIPADSIAEMHYVGCWDQERPYLRNSLSIVLKPPRAARAAPAPAFSPQPRPAPALRFPPGVPDTATPPREPTRAAVAGVAIDGLHEESALAGALVSVRGTPFEAITDSLGRYRIDGLPPGEYRLAAAHPLLDTLGVTLVTPPTRLHAGTTTALNLPLPPAAGLLSQLCAGSQGDTSAGIVGMVIDAETEAPLANARVTFTWSELQVGKPAEIRQVSVSREAVSDATGHYRLCGPLGGTIGQLRAATDSGAATAELPIYLAMGQLVLGVLHVDGNARGGVGWAGVAGRVVNDAGHLVAGAAVSLVGTAARTISDGRGLFTIADVPGGTQLLVVERAGYAPVQLAVVLSARRVANVTVMLLPTGRSAPNSDTAPPPQAK